MSDVRVKICGITNKEDALKAVEFGAWALGFVFYKKSPRYISASRVRKIVEALPPFVTPVGVFVDENERAVRDMCRFARIHTVQFHGEEDARYCTRFKEYNIIKAFRVGPGFNFDNIQKYQVSAYLFDAYDDRVQGGSGRTFDWNLLGQHTIKRPFILSGGLNPENIEAALKTVSPYAVDVSSGVEKTPGIKNPDLMYQFFKRI